MKAAVFVSTSLQTTGTPTQWKSNAVVVKAADGPPGGVVTYQSYAICSSP
jgi:hypothetical protein